MRTRGGETESEDGCRAQSRARGGDPRRPGEPRRISRLRRLAPAARRSAWRARRDPARAAVGTWEGLREADDPRAGDPRRARRAFLRTARAISQSAAHGARL